MKISESELVTLIRESTRGQCVECSFGTYGARLLDTTENGWAVKRVLEMRDPEQIGDSA